uniref:CCHC-type domain-containing protein n=1 Tax=Aegilops tauschii subsp. strangulata TaxID=200361 RepID=A0A453QDN0_AEGTS
MSDRRTGGTSSGTAGPSKTAVQKSSSYGGVSSHLPPPSKDPAPAPKPTKSTASTTASSQVQSSQPVKGEIKQVLDPRYKDMICFNCGGPGHYVGNCAKPKTCFVCQQNHNVNNCAAWSKVHPLLLSLAVGQGGLVSTMLMCM